MTHIHTSSMEVMATNERQEMASHMPVITRLDRLDRMVKLLEETNNWSKREVPCNARVPVIEDKDECKTLSSALEEIQHKGTLIERIALLESRVLQLTLEMEEGSMWNSSSSRVQVDKMAWVEAITERENDNQATVNTKGNRDQESNEIKGERKTGYGSCGLSKKGRKKWLQLFQIRC